MPNSSIDLTCRPTLTAISIGQERTLHVLIRIRAGLPKGKAERLRLSTVLALDVSGSMNGQPLAHVLRSTERIVDLLEEGDAVGVVAFSSSAQVVTPLRRLDASTRRQLQGEVRKLRAEGGTNISAGMSCAASLFPPRSPGEQQLLLLLSDGQPSVGPSTPRELASEAGQIRARNIVISTLGYGAQHDENVLINIAELGGGRYAFVSEPQLAESSFVQALGNQLDVVLESPRLVLTPSEDADIVRVLGDLRTSVGADGLRVSLRDLIAGDEIRVAVEVRVRAWREGEWCALYATLSGQDASGGAFHTQAQASFSAHAGPELGDLEALAEVGVVLADEQRTRARGLAAQRDFDGAVAVLQQALRAIEATPGFQRGRGDPLDDAYDALLDDCTVYEQEPEEDTRGGGSKRMSPSALAMDARRRCSASGSPARLVIEEGPGEGQVYPQDGRTVIGRGHSCDVVISRQYLSRQHALIEQLDDAFWLVDMGSTNGVWVRGRQVQRHELQPGDRFELGGVRIRFERG